MAATLKCDTLQNASSATANITLDTAGNATVGGTLAMGSSFLRNRIINGDMRIAQRGTSFSLTSGYTVDRWACNSTGGTLGVAQVANPATGFPYGIQLTGGAGITQAVLWQRIESVNIADLAGSAVTLQVNIKASTNQPVQWATYYADAVDNYTGITLIASGSFNATTTATTFSAQMTLPANAANGVWVLFYPQNGGAFTSGTVTFTGVQLEVGSVATPFERELYSQTLSKCQRYFILQGKVNSATPFMGGAYATTAAYSGYQFPSTMRSAPTLSYSALSDWNVLNGSGGGVAITGWTINNATTQSGEFLFTVASGLTVGQASSLQAANANATFSLSAEL